MAEDFAALTSDIHHFGRLATHFISSVLGPIESPSNNRAVLRRRRIFVPSSFSLTWVGNPVELRSTFLATQESHCYLTLLLLVPRTDGIAAHLSGHPLMSAKKLL